MLASPEADGLLRDARILITGGLGCIGSNLARRLIECGLQIAFINSLVLEAVAASTTSPSTKPC